MTISRRFLIVSAAILPLAMGAPSIASASQDAARGLITQLGKETVETLQSKDVAKRRAGMEDILRRGFDFSAIGRFVLGRHWNTAQPQQRARSSSRSSPISSRNPIRAGWRRKPRSPAST